MHDVSDFLVAFVVVVIRQIWIEMNAFLHATQ